VGALSQKFALAAGESVTVTFVVAWHFSQLKLGGLGEHRGRWYGTRFANAWGVVDYIAQNLERLASETRLWHDTWYDSTLPYWFLDRTMAPTSHLATSTCHWLGNGRFYGWEGVGCCAGTCTHVWHYAHAVARLFPSLERNLRERVDYGIGFEAKTGRIRFRAEHNDHWAADGQAGVILRTYREHQMSVDDGFLRRVWPRTRQALEFLIAHDRDNNGLLEGAQHNTLDADWWGPVAWLSGLYLAALRAGETMAREMGDDTFAQDCRKRLEQGQATLVRELFNGDYFINQPDPNHLAAINSGTGCHIDQVFGQSWAWQVGLGRVLPERETRSALAALWRYNFTRDVGPWRTANKPGRWYAMAGEGGLIMCTFPRSDWDYRKAAGKGPDWAAGYFNECMNGFEYQVAWHMIAEGLVQEGLAVTRMIHDRYHPARRNPWNEVECGDHYARSMASYGVFLAISGYEYHGPKGHLGFAPHVNPQRRFQCAFTAAEGWGSYRQEVAVSTLTVRIGLRWGRLRLRTFSVAVPAGVQPRDLTVRAAGQPVAATLAIEAGKAVVTFGADVNLKAGEILEMQLVS
jgi:non-lysosomal glucosylceramidase